MDKKIYEDESGGSQPESNDGDSRPELEIIERGEISEVDDNGDQEILVRGGNGDVTVAEEIATIRQELEVEDSRDEIEIRSERLAQVTEFLGLKTGEVFGSAYERRIAPEVRPEQLEAVHGLVELDQERYALLEELRVFSEIFDLSIDEMRDIIDTTSSWTQDHSTRLTILGYKLMERMWDFDPEFKKTFWQAGLLHDAGKVAVPKKILDKDGKLTPDERRVINHHAEAGDILMRNMERHNRGITDGTKHHEKWGGGGYSYKLEGSQIPFISQVLGPTDVFDALVSERPYKQGFTFERAVKIIGEMSEPQEVTDRETGELVLDSKTNQPIINPEHFSKLPVAYLLTEYEGRRLRSYDYFDADRSENVIVGQLDQEAPYSRARNESILQDDREKLIASISPALQRSKLVTPEDVVRYLNEMNTGAINELSSGQQKEVDKLQEARDKLQEVYVDALFLMVKSIDARYRAYHEGSEMSELSGGQARTENVIRYSLMLAQQMSMDIKQQQQVVMAAMFADLGILSIDEEKIQSNQTLGVTSYEEFKRVPYEGYRLLQTFTGNPEIAPFFRGAEIGAAEAHLCANGDGGYGVPISATEDERIIGWIVAIASRYVALRADNPYRGDGLDQNQAMDIMRQGVGTEFDRELWNGWEALYARDVLRVFKERPYVVGEVKRLFKGEEIPIAFSSSERDKLVDYSQQILAAEDEKIKLELCFEAARYAGGIGFYSSMERFLELGEPIAFREGASNQIVELMAELYDYDLEQSKIQGLDAMRTRLHQGEVIKAIGSVEAMVTDFAERGQSLPEDLTDQIREEILPAYKSFVGKVSESYREHSHSLDKDALEKDERILQTGVCAIGDDDFSSEVEMAMKTIKQDRMKAEVRECIESIGEFTDEKSDPFNGEHLIAKAEKIFKDLTPENQESLIASLETTKRAFYRRGCSIAFEQLQKEADEGDVQIVTELEKRIRRWMSDAHWDGLTDEQFNEQKQTVYGNGITKMEAMLQADDLGLEDIPLVSRWLANIDEWQKNLNGLSTERKTADEFNAMKQRAFEVVKNNLPQEIGELLESGSLSALKRVAIMVGDYVISNPDSNLLRTHELDGQMTVVRNRIFDLFEVSLKEGVVTGQAEDVSSAIHYFYKFCGGGGRGEIIGLTDVQRAALESLKKTAYHNSIDFRIGNIERFGADARISQLDRELVRLQEDKSILHNKGEVVDEVVIGARITQAIYGSLERKIAIAVGSRDVGALSFTIDKLHQLIENGSITQEEQRIEDIREATIPVIEGLIDDIVESGRLNEFKALEKTLATLGDSEVLARLREGKEQCYRNYADRVAVKLQLHGIKSAIDSMKQLEDRLHQLEEEMPGVVDPNIFEKSQQEAERIIQSYKAGILSYQLLGSVGQSSLNYIKNTVSDIVGKLKTTPSGMSSQIALERLVLHI